MASRKSTIHTVPSNNGWANKHAGTPTPVSTHRTKSAAETEGRRQAKRDETEHVIHNKNGRISEKNSYGNDPCPPKDKNKGVVRQYGLEGQLFSLPIY